MDFNFKIPQSLQKKSSIFGGAKELEEDGSSQTGKFNKFSKVFPSAMKSSGDHADSPSSSAYSFVSAFGGERAPKVKPASKYSLVRNKDGEQVEPPRQRRMQIESEDLLKSKENILQRFQKRANKLNIGALSKSRKLLDPGKGSTFGNTEGKVGGNFELPKTLKPAIIRPSKAADLNKDQIAALSALFKLNGRSCPTDYDRYQILDERDKLLCKLRQATEKADGSGKNKSIIGLCAAMCSEKERYVRIVQNRISPYECDENGVMEEAKMVKEYARSAADQEKPLPHELRTNEMLHQSMSYLLLEILDNMPQHDDLAPWYDFLWSRTRAIRKEVTQLSLADNTAIVLVEMCTRLHILCAYILCTLPVGQFDQKMNTENLGKCLQTLRHLYDDLEKRGVYFNTEAEFRAYDVMLHLHDSNVLRQVLSYRKEVRESRPVRLAIQLASAIQNKNHVRFFRLLRNEASFLQCCVCHRFFGQIRTTALSVMVRAYQNYPFPIETIMLVLGFDERDGCVSFLEECSLQVESDQVALNRDFGSFDVLPTPMTYKWIDNKSSLAFSQVVFGPGDIRRPQPSFISNSFDANSCYTKDAVLLKLISKYSSEVMRRSSDISLQGEEEEAIAVAETSKPVNTAASQMGREQVEKIIDEVVEENVKTAAVSAYYDTTVEDLSDSVINDLLRDCVSNIYREEKLLQDLKDKKEKQLNEKKRAQEIVDDISESVIEDVIKSEVMNIAASEIREQQKEYLRDASKWIAERLWEKEILKLVDQELKKVISQTVISQTKEIDEGLARFRDRMYTLWLKQFWDTWREKVQSRKRYREQRAEQWSSFEPNFNNKYFSPLNYIRNNKDAPKSSSSTDSDIAFKLAVFTQKRKTRLCYKAIEQWRYFCKLRKVEDHLARALINTSRQMTNMVNYNRDRLQSKTPRKRLMQPPPYEYSKSPRLTSFNTTMTEGDHYFSFAASDGCSSPVLNSTALSYHTCHEFRAPTGLSDINFDQDSFMNTSVLTERDLNFARRALERHHPDDGKFNECLATSFSLPPLAKALLSQERKEVVRETVENGECEKLLHDVERSKVDVTDLEKKANDLKSSLLAHQAYLNKLINTASNSHIGPL